MLGRQVKFDLLFLPVLESCILQQFPKACQYKRWVSLGKEVSEPSSSPSF